MLIENIRNKLVNNSNIVATCKKVVDWNIVLGEGLQAEGEGDGDCGKREDGVGWDGEDEGGHCGEGEGDWGCVNNCYWWWQ